ncbi:SHOCT domain-containing protein [Speluncibacter jeojiensis]|uniref:SHOCT domain-containing protein n=1 Tax=Speluncibacter jeojiensis TaxID=2710754 RepID=A0A9X4M3J7_9ACTN|nr:SHOCT domain-containing protein [Corynebacteriales bacterium D3-21]
MVFRAGRIGRPGLLGTVARTAVVAGTASATANAVNRRSQQRAAEQQAYAEQQYAQQEAYAQQPATPQPATPSPGGEDLIAKLQQLQQLHDSGALTDDEFAAAKAKLLS